MTSHRGTWQSRFQSRFYSPKRGWVDGTTEFHSLVRRLCSPGERILEIGAGPSNQTTTFLASVGEVHGIDPDPDIKTNAVLTTATILNGEAYPYADGEFSLCVSNYVVEHIQDGIVHLKEVARVLRPNGRYVFRTVNRMHYIALISSVTPHWFHKLVANRARGLSSASHDPYPTIYAMNTAAAIRRAATAAELQVEQLSFVEKEPTYGHFSRVVFLVMMAYERVVNSWSYLAPFRINLFVVLKKPGINLG
jgi:ubiquinone/menaquinone biosynthesis C-methylase UbiE